MTKADSIRLIATGVYCINNLLNGKLYIGSAASSFSKRFSQHRRMLRAGRHHSRHLQAAWSKYGEEAFAFVPIQETKPEDAVKAEQRWMAALQPVYNVSPTAGSLRGIRFSDATKARMSASQKTVCARSDVIERKKAAAQQVVLREEWLTAHSESSKRRWLDPVYRAKRSEQVAEMWADPTYREKRAASLTAALSDSSVRQEMSKRMVKRWGQVDLRAATIHRMREKRSSLEVVEKFAAGMAAAKARPEFTETKKRASRENWARDEYRRAWEQGMAKIDVEARKVKRAAAMRARWQDPEYRERVLAARRASAADDKGEVSP